MQRPVVGTLRLRQVHLWIALALTTVIALPPIQALPGSPFEGNDGNLNADSGTDWQSFVGTSDLKVGTDLPPGQSDDSLKGKEDDPVPEIVVGSIPKNKSDLMRFYVAHETIDVAGEEKDYLYLAWVRNNILGTANMDFELNQSGVLSPNGVTQERTAGDMLITYDFASGANQINLGVSRWTETGPCEASASPPCWGPIEALDGIAEAEVNRVDVFDPVVAGTLPALTFGEASINLTDAGIFDREECISFGKAYVKSRSSDSFTAAMKDFISPIDISVSNCATIIIHKDAIPDDQQDFRFIPSVELDPAPFHLDDDGIEDNELASTKTYYDRYSGSYTVSEEAATGWDLTDVTCTEGGVPELDGEGRPTGQVTVDVIPGDRVECTYTNTKHGRIVVDKATIPSGDPQLFDFSLVGGPDGIDRSFQLADASASYDSGDLRPGTYALTELGPFTGWDLTGVVCSDGSPAGAIALDPGETVTCTFTNTKRGRIVTDKVTLPGGDPQGFDFTLTGGPGAVQDVFVLTDLADPHDSGFVKPGTYSLAETVPVPGWDLTDTSCDDGSPASAIVLDPGEVVTCTFHNTKRGRIVTDKVTDPAGDPQTFDFTLTGGPEALNDAFQLADETSPHDSGDVKPGTYSLAEQDPGDAWDLTGATCDDGSPVDAIDLGPGETVTCTFSNTKRGKIVTDKVAYPAADPRVFEFTLAGGPDGLNDTFGLNDESAPHDSGYVRHGVYSLAETGPGDEWDLTGSTCDDGSPAGAIALEPGEIVTCTFTNTKRGKIVTDKVTYPAADVQIFDFTLSGGPDGLSDAFSLSDGSTPRDSGFVRPGTYSLAEADAGEEWDLTGATCDDGSPVGAISIEPGETVNCTFTNTKRGRIVTDKVTAPAGDPAVFDFTLTGGPDGIHDTFGLTGAASPHQSAYVRPGTYSIAETDPGDEWDLTDTICDDGSPVDSIALDPGETVTCTFTNTKRGHIVVDKVTNPGGDDAVFDFTLTGGPDALNDAFSLGDGGMPHDSGPVRPGHYAAIEADAGEEWDLTGTVCDDGSAVDDIVLDPGETVTCTFTNTKRVRLTVVKNALPHDPDDFPFTLSGPDMSDTFHLDDDGEEVDDPGQGQLPSSRSYLEIPGVYSVTEGDAGPAWDATGIECTDASDESVGSIDLESRNATMDLSPGEEATCVFTNVKRGKIIVEKRLAEDYAAGATYDPAQQLFDFTASYTDPFQLKHGETHESDLLLPDRTYSVSEKKLRGWVVSSSCTYPDGTVVHGGDSIDVDLEPGAEVHCTFTNEMRIHPGTVGFWRNWRNHYVEEQFRAILSDALDSSPVYAHLFDWPTGELADDAISKIDQIYDYSEESMTSEQKLLGQFTTTMLNIGVSTSEDPQISDLQMHDDICRECELDFSDDPVAETLIRDRAPCELADPLRIKDAIDVAESAWTGDLSGDHWTFDRLTEAERWTVAGVFDDINNGRNVEVDPDSYPDDPACMAVPGPETYTWYRDADGDGFGLLEVRLQTCDSTTPDGYVDNYTDCDDTLASVYPGATEVCDGINNDCYAPGWPAVSAYEIDDDLDSFSDCGGDCDDADASVYPGAAQACDGVNNDCNDPSWPAVDPGERDDDGDSFAECGGDCDDTDGSVYPDAPWVCDGKNNNCSHPMWPTPSSRESDSDGDGYLACEGDCDNDPTRNPGTPEACNGIDDNCNGWVDEDDLGEDSDGDGVANACDVCREEYDPTQPDEDADGIGDSCDNCWQAANPAQEDLDADGWGDACDNCVDTANPHQDDGDLDGTGDSCDNCQFTENASQADMDFDGEGDVCDLDDGMIYIRFVSGSSRVEWQEERGYQAWNAYKGDVDVLKGEGLYTQAPGSNDLAQHYANRIDAWIDDLTPPAPGKCAHFLVTGLTGRGESSLGQDSEGNERPNDNPCP